MHKTVGALTLAALRPYLAGGFAFVVAVLHPLYATRGDKKYPEAGWTAKRGYLSLGASNGPGARGRELHLEVKMGTTWTSFSVARLPLLRRGPWLCAPASRRVCLFVYSHIIPMSERHEQTQLGHRPSGTVRRDEAGA
jgi:hypothetical protein